MACHAIYGETLMKKTIIITACILFFCAGLFRLHLTAQWSENPHLGSMVFDVLDSDDPPQAALTSLLDRKLEECSERELLELKVTTYRKLANYVATASKVGSPAGSAIRLAEAHTDLAAAQIELYRCTGEQNKLLAAHQARVEALTDKLRAVSQANDAGAIKSNVLYEAEVQLLDAILEQKRVPAPVNVP
jgi:hypothetical protein